MLIKGIASQNSPHAHQTTAPKSVFYNSLTGIFRTCGSESADRRSITGNTLIAFNQKLSASGQKAHIRRAYASSAVSGLLRIPALPQRLRNLFSRRAKRSFSAFRRANRIKSHFSSSLCSLRRQTSRSLRRTRFLTTAPPNFFPTQKANLVCENLPVRLNAYKTISGEFNDIPRRKTRSKSFDLVRVIMPD